VVQKHQKSQGARAPSQPGRNKEICALVLRPRKPVLQILKILKTISIMQQGKLTAATHELGDRHMNHGFDS
jgi:hypothetical protein